MKIIFFSDAHGNQYAVKEFFDVVKKVRYDKIIFGGDVIGYYYGADWIIDALRSNDVHCLLGNHDRMFLDLLEGKQTENALIKRYGNSYKNIIKKISQDNVLYLYSLNSRLDLKLSGLKLTFVHGSVEDPLNGRVYPDTEIKNTVPYAGIDYIFSGHTHHKMVIKVGDSTIINPGSIGQQRDGKGCSYVIFDTELQEYKFNVIHYDIDDLVKEICANESGVMQEKLLEVLYRKEKR